MCIGRGLTGLLFPRINLLSLILGWILTWFPLSNCCMLLRVSVEEESAEARHPSAASSANPLSVKAVTSEPLVQTLEVSKRKKDVHDTALVPHSLKSSRHELDTDPPEVATAGSISSALAKQVDVEAKEAGGTGELSDPEEDARVKSASAKAADAQATALPAPAARTRSSLSILVNPVQVSVTSCRVWQLQDHYSVFAVVIPVTAANIQFCACSLPSVSWVTFILK